jgi:hypothetical protein
MRQENILTMSDFWREILTCKCWTNVILYYIYNLYNIAKECFSRLMEVIKSEIPCLFDRSSGQRS